MNKILLSIFGIFFGLSAFCSADTVLLNPGDHGCINTYQENSFYSNVSGVLFYSCMMGSWSDINGCGDSTFSYYPGGDSISIGFSDQYRGCYSFIPYEVKQYSSNISLDLGDYGCIVDDLGSPAFSFSSDGIFGYSCYYGGTSFSSECGGGLEGVSSDTVIDYIGVDSQYNLCFSFFPNSPAPSDTFTVYYGSTSKEYTITEDIDIFINSPVIKNGNTFTFDGSTGINLFYNNSFDWYDKSKLYLGGNYSFSKGVFTPVCM